MKPKVKINKNKITKKKLQILKNFKDKIQGNKKTISRSKIINKIETK